MKQSEWNIIRFIIGEELDRLMDEKQVEIGRIELEKKDLDVLYFKIHDQVVRNIKIEEDVKSIKLKPLIL